MKIPKKIIDDFVSTVNKKQISKNPIMFAEVVSKENDEIFVKIDGSNELTPVDKLTIDAEVGDRVQIQTKDHKMIIIGNETSPPSARTASSYMKLDNSGLIIGKLDETGHYTEAYEDTFTGDDSTTNFSLSKEPSNNRAIIVKVNDVIQNRDVEYTYDNITNSISFLVAPVNDSNISISYRYIVPAVYLLLTGSAYEIMKQVGENIDPVNDLPLAIFKDDLISGDDKIMIRSSLESYGWSYLSLKANELQIGVENESWCFLILDPNNKSAPFYEDSAGGSNVLLERDLFEDRKIYWSSNKQLTGQSIGGNTNATFITPVTVPDGYTLLGIRSIITNHNSVCHITQFSTDMTHKQVGVTLYNHNSSAFSDLVINFYYFCIRSSL